MAHTSAALEHRKVFVEVTVKVSPEGEVRPLSITFEDGIKYETTMAELTPDDLAMMNDNAVG